MLNGPSACRNGHPCETVGLKETLHCGIAHMPGGSLIEPIATHLDIKPNTLRDYVNPNEPDWPHAKHLDAIAVFTKDHPVIARHYATLQGGFFYKVPATTFDQATATSVREFGEFLQSLGSGPLTPPILERIKKEGREAMAAIQAVISGAELRAAVGTK
jgi:hypothetical protein